MIDQPSHYGGPGEEITPAEAFLAGVSACGVLLVEQYAKAESIGLARVEALIEAGRDPANTGHFERISIRFHISGATQANAEQLVARYREH